MTITLREIKEFQSWAQWYNENIAVAPHLITRVNVCLQTLMNSKIPLGVNNGGLFIVVFGVRTSGCVNVARVPFISMKDIFFELNASLLFNY